MNALPGGSLSDRRTGLVSERRQQGVWVPFDASAMQTMQDDYRRLWDTGRLSDLTIAVTDYMFDNGVVGKFVTYSLKERAVQ
jgi:hypothetical protein